VDKATVIGIASAWGVVLLGILIAPGSRLSAFVDYPSMMMVVGGAIAAVLIAYPLKTFLSVPKVAKKAVFPNVPKMGPVIAQLVEFSEIARRDGILALESKTDEVEDPFILLGIQMAVDGTDSETIECILRSEMEAVAGRHKIGKSLLDTLNKYAPAFGMIGTLVGLIIMLGNMDDPAAIGPGMAVALLTTLYGAAVSNMICAPLSDKLAFYSKQELQVREIIIRGILSIQDGDNPRVLAQKLNTVLPINERPTEEKAA
jgi:chemotaxis protein MotA